MQHDVSDLTRSQEHPLIAYSWTLIRKHQCPSQMVWIHDNIYHDHTHSVSLDALSIAHEILTESRVYAAGLHATHYAYLLTTPGTIGADVAGIAMILMLLTANGYVRRRNYEFFYFAHTALIMISLITGLPSEDFRSLSMATAC